MEAALERAPVGVLVIGPAGRVEAVNRRALALFDLEDPGGELFRDVFPESVEYAVVSAVENRAADAQMGESTSDAIRQEAGQEPENVAEMAAGTGVVPGTDADEAGYEVTEYYPGIDRWVETAIARVDDGVVLYCRDCSRRYDHQQSLESLREELGRLSNINSLISDILAELVGASTREEIAETICNRTGETDLYEFAWVGEREIGSEAIAVRASAGETGRTLESVADCLDDATTPEERAVETATPQLVETVSEADAVPERVRRGAFADGIQSLLAIPLTYASSVYGVVGIYAADRQAFTERERANFATVGEMAGFAINAARHRNLLLSDTVVELDLAIEDRVDPLVDVTAAQNATFDLDGVVPQPDGGLLCYLSLSLADSAATPESVAGALAAAEGVGLCRVLGEHDDGGTLEVALDESTALGRLAARGATVRTASFGQGSGRVTVELSPSEDLRRIVDALTRSFDAHVEAKRERERDVTTRGEFRDQLSDELTERQENALRAAFFANYFESPRGSTAEEVAEALDITGPTLLYHLRAGQRKLLSEFFETTAE